MGGVYTRDADARSSGLAVCQYISFEHTPAIVTSPPAAAVSLSTQNVTETSAAVPTSLPSASQVPTSNGLSSPTLVVKPLSPPPAKPLSPAPMKSPSSVPRVKTGIMPPTNVSAVSLSVPASSKQAASQSLSDRGWKEFEEALSEEFDSEDGSSRSTKDVMLSSSVLLPKTARDPESDTVLSTAAFCAFCPIVPSMSS